MLPVTIKNDSYKLEVLISRPSGNTPRPLAVLTHGVPRARSSAEGVSNRRKFSPYAFIRTAEEFARRGYITAIVMRFGFGKSEGRYSENYVSCNNANFLTAGRNAAGIIGAAVDSLILRPDVDRDRILVVGHSGGGFGTIALTSQKGNKVTAAINFAGGRGANVAGKICSERKLVEAFTTFGQTSRVPSLWLYSRNDGYFSPDVSERLFDAFVDGGGEAKYELLDSFGKDGHQIFSSGLAGVHLWRNPVDRFLKTVGLPTWDSPPAELYKKIPPPEELNIRNRRKWERYLKGGDNKAFAISEDGYFGWSTRRRTVEEAEEGALGFCKGDCRIVSVNGKMVE